MYRVVVGDEEGEGRRRRRNDEDEDDGDDSLLRSSIFRHSDSALCSERSAHLDGRMAGFGAVEMVSVMGKHLRLRGVGGHESG